VNYLEVYLKISAEQYLKRLSSDLKYDALYSLMAPKTFKIQLPDFEPIDVYETDLSIQLMAKVGELIDHIDQEKCFAYLLNANYLGQGTGQQLIGLHPNQKTILLSHHIYFDIDYIDFKERIEQLFNYVDFFKKHLQTKIPSFLIER
jgi:hypothetical protein